MGVDISGMNPIVRSKQPKSPDWDTASDKEKEHEMLKKTFGIKNIKTHRSQWFD
jgi:hypothetical protein